MTISDKEKIKAEIIKRIKQIEAKKKEYEKYEVWGEVPELRGKLSFAYDILLYVDSLL